MSLVTVGCGDDAHDQRMAELEQKLEELTQKVDDLISLPKLLETIDRTVNLRINPAALLDPELIGPRYTGYDYDGYITISLGVGNRVEGEVTASDPNVTRARVINPTRRSIFETKYDPATDRNTQVYPWTFAFTAVIPGDYTFQIDTGHRLIVGTTTPTANVLIHIYNK